MIKRNSVKNATLAALMDALTVIQEEEQRLIREIRKAEINELLPGSIWQMKHQDKKPMTVEILGVDRYSVVTDKGSFPRDMVLLWRPKTEEA